MKSVNEEMLESLEIIKDQKLKNELSKIVERFNKNYKTKLDKIFIQKPTAYNLFEKYTDKIYSSNELKQGFNDIIENVLKEDKLFNEEQKEFIKTIYLCANLMADEIIRESFLNGYEVVSDLKNELTKNSLSY